MTRLRLRTRLAIWFAASILLILTPFLLGILALQWRSMRAALDHHLEEDLEVAVQMLELRDGQVIWRSDSPRDPGYDAGPQRWVEVYSLNGQVEFLHGVPLRDEIRAALPPASNVGEGYRTLHTPAGAFVRTFTSVRRVGDTDFRVRVARSEDNLRAQFRQLALLFALAAPLAVLAAAVAGYVISGRALAPLTTMADRARSISADHLSERLPVENPDDELGRLAFVFNDTFARLQASFERLKQFTADASHELRTPLTAIRSVGEVGLREPRDTHDYREIIGSMLEEADRLARVVETLLTLSRWESGRVRPAIKDFDLRGLTDDVVAQLSVLAEERHVTIRARLDRPLVVRADPGMVRQALTNVLDNAIKFSPQGGEIRISFETGPAEQRLIVDDDGPGIPPQERERVLQRFYRIGDSAEGAAAGAGLGLAIVHWAVTANAGRVNIDSSPAGGTRVVIGLPRAAPHGGR